MLRLTLLAKILWPLFSHPPPTSPTSCFTILLVIMPQRSRVLPSCFHFSTKRTKRMLGVVMRRILWKGFSHLFNSSWDLWKGMLLYYSIIQNREQEFHEGIFSVESRLIVPNSNHTWFGTWLKMYLAFILLDWNEWNLTILVHVCQLLNLTGKGVQDH